jgi:adenylate cyclase
MNKRIPIFIGLLLVVFAVWIQISTIGALQHYINRLESLAYDIQLRARLLTHLTPFKTSVAIVDIDDKTLNREGRWPWSRAKLATLITKIQEAGAVVITLDIILPEKEINVSEEVLKTLKQKQLLTSELEDTLIKSQSLFDNDAILAHALQQGDSEMGISFLPRDATVNQLKPPLLVLKTPQEKTLDITKVKGYISNIPIIQNAIKSAGFVNVFADEDGIIRSVPLLLRYQDGLYPSLALEAVRLFLLADVKLETQLYGDTLRLEGVNIGGHVIPTDAEGRVIVPFRGKSFTFPYFSATDVLNNHIPKDVLLGKIVFVGTSATGLGDLPATSVESVFPGVEIQATIADGILSNNFSYKPAWAEGVEIFLTLVLGILFSLLFPYFGPRLLSLMIILVPAFLIFFNNVLWEKTGLIISIFIPILLTLFLAIINMIYGYLFETRRRESLKEMFGQYVPEEHIDEMLSAAGSNYGLYGEDREMTVLFADIRNFTTISESLTATQLKEMLNDFFTPMTEIIFKHKGTIDKYVGDMIMAFWGAPMKDKRHSQHAMLAALDMQKKLTNMQPLLAARGWPTIQIGIGLNSGIMSVGDMGSTFRRNYTVLGDAVNLASRVEGLTKFYGVKIIVTEATKGQHSHFIFRELDCVQVKGKVKGVALFELVCRESELSPALAKELEESELALQAYYAMDWSRAKEMFIKLHDVHPEVKLYRLYLSRIAEYIKTPPSQDWGGVFVHTEK